MPGARSIAGKAISVIAYAIILVPQPIKKLLLCLFHFLSAATTHHLPFSLRTPSLWLLVPFQLQLLLKRGMILHLSSLPQQSRNPWRILSSYNSESYISTTFNLGSFFTTLSPSILWITLIQPKKTRKAHRAGHPTSGEGWVTSVIHCSVDYHQWDSILWKALSCSHSWQFSLFYFIR